MGFILAVSSAGNFYISLVGGLVLLLLFLGWAFALIKTLLGGKDNTNLQKMYGQGRGVSEDNKRKHSLARLAVSGVLLVFLAVLYYVLL